MSAAEQIILTVSANGYGKRTSSYEYRITGRGGKGIVAMAVNQRNGKLRRIDAGRGWRRDHARHQWRSIDPLPGRWHPGCRPRNPGVIVFNTADGEQVVAVERITEEDAGRGGDEEPRAGGLEEDGE